MRLGNYGAWNLKKKFEEPIHHSCFNFQRDFILGELKRIISLSSLLQGGKYSVEYSSMYTYITLRRTTSI